MVFQINYEGGFSPYSQLLLANAYMRFRDSEIVIGIRTKHLIDAQMQTYQTTMITINYIL